ncbi:MAG: ISAs1 family transposase [Spirochaetota bacterium]
MEIISERNPAVRFYLQVVQCLARRRPLDPTRYRQGRERFKGLSSICMVKSQRTIAKQTCTRYLYKISSLPADAEQLAHLVRAHWGIENSLHWVLDVDFREDECRKRKDNSAENFAILQRSIAGNRLLAGWDTSYIEQVLFTV